MEKCFSSDLPKKDIGRVWDKRTPDQGIFPRN